MCNKKLQRKFRLVKMSNSSTSVPDSESCTGSCYFDSLPPEIVTMVANKLSPRDIMNFSKTSARYQEILQGMWLKKLRDNFVSGSFQEIGSLTTATLTHHGSLIDENQVVTASIEDNSLILETWNAIDHRLKRFSIVLPDTAPQMDLSHMLMRGVFGFDDMIAIHIWTHYGRGQFIEYLLGIKVDGYDTSVLWDKTINFSFDHTMAKVGNFICSFSASGYRQLTVEQIDFTTGEVKRITEVGGKIYRGLTCCYSHWITSDEPHILVASHNERIWTLTAIDSITGAVFAHEINFDFVPCLILENSGKVLMCGKRKFRVWEMLTDRSVDVKLPVNYLCLKTKSLDDGFQICGFTSHFLFDTYDVVECNLTKNKAKSFNLKEQQEKLWRDYHDIIDYEFTWDNLVVVFKTRRPSDSIIQVAVIPLEKRGKPTKFHVYDLKVIDRHAFVRNCIILPTFMALSLADKTYVEDFSSK